MKPIVIKAGDNLIPLHCIQRIDISDVEAQEVKIITGSGIYIAKGFDAIEALMVLKPSALEGRRLKWNKGAWAFHNIVGHPVMQIMAWFGFSKAAVRFHDRTTPRPR